MSNNPDDIESVDVRSLYPSIMPVDHIMTSPPYWSLREYKLPLRERVRFWLFKQKMSLRLIGYRVYARTLEPVRDFMRLKWEDMGSLCHGCFYNFDTGASAGQRLAEGKAIEYGKDLDLKSKVPTAKPKVSMDMDSILYGS